MKAKLILLALVGLAIGGGIAWTVAHRPAVSTADAAARKILYYTCSMHPWVRESKPGPCPVCGMKLVPIYEPDSGTVAETGSTNSNSGTVTLGSESVSVINVQTDVVERRPVRRTLHFAGEITGNSWTVAWLEFTAYERDLPWLKVGQTFEVVVSSAPEKIYHAQIKLHGTKPFVEKDFDMMSGSTTIRAEILNPPIEAGDLGTHRTFNNLHAEAHVVTETEETLTIPRSAVISRGSGPMVYVAKGDGHYAPRTVQLGRMGDEFSEVLDGLSEGEKVVTTGNLLIDSEAQLTAGQ